MPRPVTLHATTFLSGEWFDDVADAEGDGEMEQEVHEEKDGNEDYDGGAMKSHFFGEVGFSPNEGAHTSGGGGGLGGCVGGSGGSAGEMRAMVHTLAAELRERDDAHKAALAARDAAHQAALDAMGRDLRKVLETIGQGQSSASPPGRSTRGFFGLSA